MILKNSKKTSDDIDICLTSANFKMTSMLKKRKIEEERLAKNNIKKKKTYTILH